MTGKVETRRERERERGGGRERERGGGGGGLGSWGKINTQAFTEKVRDLNHNCMLL